MGNEFEGGFSAGGNPSGDWSVDTMLAGIGDLGRREKFADSVLEFTSNGLGRAPARETQEDGWPSGTESGHLSIIGQAGGVPPGSVYAAAGQLQSFLNAGKPAGGIQSGTDGGFEAKPVNLSAGQGADGAQNGSPAPGGTQNGAGQGQAPGVGQPPANQYGPGNPVVKGPGEANASQPQGTSGQQQQGQSAPYGSYGQNSAADQNRANWERLKGIEQSPEALRQQEERRRWEEEKGVDRETMDKFGRLWPSGGVVTSPYGERVDPTGKTQDKEFHPGIDLHNPMGSPVYASQSGEVISVDPVSGYGSMVKVRNRDGTISWYAHSSPTVKKGDWVLAGDQVGKSDGTGRSTRPHLHYELRDATTNKTIDPMTRLPQRGKK